MVLSEAEAERRLEGLRRQREAIDRAITDLMLYLELGRRLGAARAAVAQETATIEAEAGTGSEADCGPGHDEVRHGPRAREPHAAKTALSLDVERSAPSSAGLSDGPLPGEAAPEAVPSPEDGAGGVLARRYGRALVQAAVSVLEEAGRPLHVGEILAALRERGFSIPGHQDPAAALNTRLWKRSGPGGSVRRLGDAVYVLPDREEAPD